MTICVYGAASDTVMESYKEKCFSLCKALALKGHNLIYGAGSSGLMGAAAKGFRAGGGKVHGIIPKFFKDNGYEEIFYDADELTYTEDMAERKRRMEDGCDAFVIVPGGIGTFEEFFEALTLKQLGRHKKAILVYNINGYYDGLSKIFDSIIEKKFVNKECLKLFYIVDNEKDAINYIAHYNTDDVNWNRLKRGDIK